MLDSASNRSEWFACSLLVFTVVLNKSVPLAVSAWFKSLMNDLRAAGNYQVL